MKVFVTGVGGQLGYDVMRELSARGWSAVGSDLAPVCDLDLPYVPLDLTDAAAVERVLSEIRPDAVIHCAGWTAVDAAEEPENREKVFRVNRDATRNIADVCKTLDCKMVYISTDYVFDGNGTAPWQPDDRSYAPQNVYGESKLAGETATAGTVAKFFVVRIAWVFGIHGKNFVRTMLNVGKTHGTVRVVNDQIGSPTYTRDVSVLLCDLIASDRYGYYHATNEGDFISWFEFTEEIYRQAGLATKVIPVTTAEYGLSKAKRPFNSRLDKSKLDANGFARLPDWRDALGRYLEELKKEEN